MANAAAQFTSVSVPVPGSRASSKAKLITICVLFSAVQASVFALMYDMWGLGIAVSAFTVLNNTLIWVEYRHSLSESLEQ